MQSIFSKTLLSICSLSILFNSLPATSFEDQKKSKMIQDLEVIKHNYEVGYAPAKWKNEYSGWDLEKAFEQAKNQVLETPTITTKQFQIIVRRFIKAMKDYHVDVIFFSTEQASLPFTIKGAEGRYFINWVDPLRLPPSHFSIRVGDELLEFDERPIVDVIKDLKLECCKSATAGTDQSLAEMKLTLRIGTAGDMIPRGGVVVKTRSALTNKVTAHQLSWSYTPEHVRNPLDFLPALDFMAGLMPISKAKKIEFGLPKIKMENPLHEIYANKYADHSRGLGASKSFIPLLGEPIWKYEEKAEEEDKLFKWNAYIYQHPNGQTMGYIRIPHYAAGSPQAKKFGEIINHMEEKTDALVIDQVHNPGGYVLFLYELASMLASEPLKTPHHRIKITQQEVIDAYEKLEFIKLLDLILTNEEKTNEENNDSSKEEKNEEEDQEIGFSYQNLMFLKSYFQLVLEEWNQGHTLTRPTPILGIDRINPHPKYQYTKPILMLIDEMDFSGGDFMPAILQDNQRALLFGNRTAGAGGYVSVFEFPNSHGIALCSYTASIAIRPDLQKIENLGVTPDIEYQITAQDLQEGYRGYINAVNQAVECLLEKTQK